MSRTDTPAARPNARTVALVALIAGGAIGAGGAWLQAAMRPWQVGGFRPDAPASRTDVPVVEAAATVHDFGTLGTGAEGSHEFILSNAGTAPLTLTRGASSCACTVGGFAAEGAAADAIRTVVPPGGSTTVRVEWKGKGPAGPFRQQVTILTDDPRRPEVALVVEGTLIPTWKSVPESLALPGLSASTGTRAEATFFTYGTKPPRVQHVGVVDPEFERFFAVSAAPLDAAAVAAETGATGGFRLSVDVKPGLPLGVLRQTIAATFAIPEEVTAELPVEGTVTGDLMLAGRGWDGRRQALMLGTVSGSKGMETRLFLTAKGPHRSAVRPVVREVVPDSLRVTVGEGAPVGTGGVVRIPLEISVPPGSRPANHLCSQQGPAGRIVVETGHPDSPSLTIPVCIAIGP